MNKVIIFMLFIIYYIGLYFIPAIPDWTLFILFFSMAVSIGMLIFSVLFIIKKYYYFIITLVLSFIYVYVILSGVIHELYE